MFPLPRRNQNLVNLGFNARGQLFPVAWNEPEPGVCWGNSMRSNYQTWASATPIASWNWINLSGANVLPAQTGLFERVKAPNIQSERGERCRTDV
jgi:hypothetical protein